MNTDTETLTGTTTRPVTMSVVDHATRLVTETRTFPAGTTVYAKENRRGLLTVRIPGTLFTQEVNGATVAPA